MMPGPTCWRLATSYARDIVSYPRNKLIHPPGKTGISLKRVIQRGICSIEVDRTTLSKVRWIQFHLESGAVEASVRRCCLCGKEGVRRKIVACTSIFLMQASGLERSGRERFQGRPGFFPDAVFHGARGER